MSLKFASALTIIMAVATAAMAQGVPDLLWLWNPMMPAAVYFDGTNHIQAPVPYQSWPWANGAPSKGFMSVWLKLPSPISTGATGLFQFAPTLPITTSTFDGSTAGVMLMAGFLGPNQAFSLYAYFSENDKSCDYFDLPQIVIDNGNPCLPIFGPVDNFTHPFITQDNQWHNLLFGWDVSGNPQLATMSIDRVPIPISWDNRFNNSEGFSVSTAATQLINFFYENLLNYNNYGNPYGLLGGASEFWLLFGEDYDAHDPIIMDKFIDRSLHQVYLGPNGERPFGEYPDFYFSAERPHVRWGCNQSGGPTTNLVGKQPPRIPGPNAVITVGPHGWVPNLPGPLPPWPYAGKPQGNC